MKTKKAVSDAPKVLREEKRYQIAYTGKDGKRVFLVMSGRRDVIEDEFKRAYNKPGYSIVDIEKVGRK